VTGDVDLDISFFDVVGLGIIGEFIWQLTEDADTRAGGTDLDIGHCKVVYDLLRPRKQSVLLDAVVEVDAHDPTVDTDADAVIACCGCRSVKGYEGRCVIHIGFACSPRCVWYFGLFAISQFVLPVAELVGVF